MPVRRQTLMGGTTLCPHCNTRFKIAEAQLEAHRGMVRCGHCLQAFDARPGYVPDQPSPQLELLVLDEPVAPAGRQPADRPPAAEEARPAAEEAGLAAEAAPTAETVLAEAAPPAEEAATPEIQNQAVQIPENGTPKIDFDDLPDFDQPVAAAAESEAPRAAGEPVALTLAERVAIVRDEDESGRAPPAQSRRWPWAVGAFLLLLALLAQATYFFRVDIAARLPGLKPALLGYCQLLGCGVPLPQNSDLMSIESSDLEADPARANQITLNALLRNRAPYAQAFPNLELTLNDTNDKPLARRSFTPKDYLPPQENEQTGLRPDHELTVKLYLDTADLTPTGYRLVLFYPPQ